MTKPLRGRPLQKGIIELAHRHGWRVAHFPPISTTRNGQTYWLTPVAADGKGWLDLCLVRDRIVFAEVKGDGDRLKPEQQLWMQTLTMAGAEVWVWTPTDWRTGVIDRVLSTRDRMEAARARDEQLVIR